MSTSTVPVTSPPVPPSCIAGCSVREAEDRNDVGVGQPGKATRESKGKGARIRRDQETILKGIQIESSHVSVASDAISAVERLKGRFFGKDRLWRVGPKLAQCK